MKNIYIVLTIVIVYLLYKNKNVVRTKINSYKMVINENDIKQAFIDLKKIFTKETLQVTEKILRLETAHFSSGGYKNTLGAGMEVFKNSFPYGWNSLKIFWEQNPQFAPVKFWTVNENVQKDVKNSGVKKTFLVFPSVISGIATTAQIMKLRGNNAGAWFSKDLVSQERYNSKIEQIKARYV